MANSFYTTNRVDLVNQGTTPWIVSGSVVTSPDVNIHDSAGNPLTSVAGSLNVNVSNIVAVSQSGVWSVGRTWTLASGTDSVDAVQSGTWTTGRTWTLSSGTDSVNIGNFPATVAVTQSTTPWVTSVSGTVAVTQSTSPWTVDGTVTANQGTSPWTVDGTVIVNQGTSPWVVSGTVVTSPDVNIHDSAGNTLTSTAGSLDVNVSNTVAVSQSGVWSVGRTWTLSSGTDSVASVQSGTWTVQQGSPPWSVSQSGTWNINNITGTVSLPTGASTSANQTNGNQQTQIVQGGNTATVTASNALKVDGSAVTQPVSGTVTANQGTSPWVVSGTVTTSPDVNIHDGAGNSLTSQVNGTQRALDVGIDVAGVQIDPRQASPGTLTDRSGSATTTSALLAASNTARKYLFIQNNSGGTIWFNFGVAAVSSQPSIRLQPGDTFSMEGSYISTQSINVISASGTRDFSAKEG